MTDRSSMEYWDSICAASLRRDLPFADGTPAARGRFMNKLFTIRIRRGEPVEARELGQWGTSSVVFGDPIKVFDDLASGRLEPFHQVATGQIELSDFFGRFLFSRRPDRFYTGPLLYFRHDDSPPPAGAVRLGPAEWQAFQDNVAIDLPLPDASQAPLVDGLMMQRILQIKGRDGRIAEVSELPGGGEPAKLWEPADLVWTDLANGALSPARHAVTTYKHVEQLYLRLLYIKDAQHIGYELGLR